MNYKEQLADLARTVPVKNISRSVKMEPLNGCYRQLRVIMRWFIFLKKIVAHCVFHLRLDVPSLVNFVQQGSKVLHAILVVMRLLVNYGWLIGSSNLFMVKIEQ